MDKAGLNKEKMVEAAMNAVGNDLVSALRTLGMANAYDVVSEAIESWIDTNVTEDLGKSPLLDLILTGSSTGNQALYDLVDAVAEQAYTFIADNNIIKPGTTSAYSATPESLADAVKATKPSEYNMLVDLDLADYFFSVIADKLHEKDGTHKMLTFDADENPVWVEITFADEEVIVGMNGQIDAMVYDMVIDTIKANTTADQQKMLKTVMKLKSIDTAKDLELGDLAPILTSSAAKKIMDKYEDTVVERITALIRYIPDEASIILPNGVEVKEATLAKVRDAKTFGQACSATADLLKNFADLSLSSFAESKDITVKYDGQNKDIEITVGLMITID